MGRRKNTKLVLLSIVYTISKAIRRGPLFPPVDALPSSISTPVFSLFFRWRSATMRKPTRVIGTGRPRESLFQRSWAMLMHRPRRIIIKCGRSEIWWWWLSAADSTVFGNLIGKWQKEKRTEPPWKFSRRIDVERFYNRRAVCLDAEALIGSTRSRKKI